MIVYVSENYSTFSGPDSLSICQLLPDIAYHETVKLR